MSRRRASERRRHDRQYERARARRKNGTDSQGPMSLAQAIAEAEQRRDERQPK